MKNLRPVDIIVIILTSTVCISLIMSIIRPFFSSITVSVEAGKLISNIIVSMLSIVSVYVGLKIKDNDRTN